MLQIKATIKDAAGLEKALARFEGDVQQKLTSFLKREGALMEKELKQSLAVSAQTGTHPAEKPYKNLPAGRTIKEFTPSAPGEPPRKRTTNLQAAQGHRVKVEGKRFILDVGGINGGGKEVEYQHDLEVGRSNMQARPHLTPIAARHISDWPKQIAVVVKEVKTK